MISNFFFNFTKFFVIVKFFLTELLTLGALFSTAIRVVLVAKLAMSGILFTIFLILALYTSFLTTLFFTTSLN